MDRRNFIHLGSAAVGAALASAGSDARAQAARPSGTSTAAAASTPTSGHVAVVTPNGSTLPLRLVDGVKVGHLVAEIVNHEFAPGLRAECWGWNGSTPGPTIECVEGDRLRLYVSNRLPEPTTVHWHGLVLPNGMDGVSGLTQRAIPPGETYVYEFTVRYPGTFMYHPHYDEMTQIALGMVGMFVVNP
jgi:FtsP/CotA-like multicopper oxidase with cupredoxin domain